MSESCKSERVRTGSEREWRILRVRTHGGGRLTSGVDRNGDGDLGVAAGRGQMGGKTRY
ncbi:hypothetical protein BOTBODRAFT_577161 [Botryobasidium botryosum FD-172 SS1]|uniref:Uncharacterized protein n=1 Tax=Botryobasidium botryosum (strain FD-172 SS1) TaxID=930990 RepID=A0A067N053_BOTB1|nr:hypothetical protein BOTBODRAFT_577161 [Botryobasidium botryosum FD-172 SS1]